MNSKDLERARRFCAYRERCHSEVRRRLIEWKIYGDDLENIMVALIDEGFLNEERFARAYVRGKFSINHWGRNKIREQLYLKQVSEYCIRKGMEEITVVDYEDVISRLIARRKLEKPGHNAYQIIQFLTGKGYEYEIVKQIMNDDESGMDR